jgi:hypothetical protein
MSENKVMAPGSPEHRAAVREGIERAANARNTEAISARERRLIVAEWLRQNPAKAVESRSVHASEMEQLKAELRVALVRTDSAAALERLLEMYESENAQIALDAHRSETLLREAVLKARKENQ